MPRTKRRQLILTLALLALCSFVFFQSSSAQANSYQISAAGSHTCALDDSGVVCWGDNYHGETNVPSLKFSK